MMLSADLARDFRDAYLQHAQEKAKLGARDIDLENGTMKATGSRADGRSFTVVLTLPGLQEGYASFLAFGRDAVGIHGSEQDIAIRALDILLLEEIVPADHEYVTGIEVVPGGLRRVIDEAALRRLAGTDRFAAAELARLLAESGREDEAVVWRERAGRGRRG